MKIPLDTQINHMEQLGKYFAGLNLAPDTAASMAEMNTACLTTLKWLQKNEGRIKSALAGRSGENKSPPPPAPPDEQPDKSPKKPPEEPLEEQMKNAVKAAAIHCKEADFQTFMQSEWREKGWSFTLSDDPEKRCAHQVRAWCQVNSRASFGKYPHKFRNWQSLLRKYYFWKENA